MTKITRADVSLSFVAAMLLCLALYSLNYAAPQGKSSKNREKLDAALIWAVGENNLRWVKTLLKQGADANARERTSRTPVVHFAVYKACDGSPTTMVKLLLDRGARVDARDMRGNTALMGAVRWGRIPVPVARLLLSRGANVNTQDNEGLTALTFAAHNGDLTMARLLLAKGASVKGKAAEEALVAASRPYDISVAPLLISRGANINASSRQGTALIAAVNRDYPDWVQWLLEHGADVNGESRAGETPLMAAAAVGNAEITKLLLARGAKVNVVDKWGDTPLRLATQACGIDMENEVYFRFVKGTETVKAHTSYINTLLALLDAGADIKRDGVAALISAARDGHAAAVQALLDKGADVNGKDERGETPLMRVALFGRKNGIGSIDTQLQGIEPKTRALRQAALQRYVNEGDVTIAKALIAKGADVNAKNYLGIDALMYAAERGHTVVVKVLLENGADVNSKDTFGDTALERAISGGYKDIIELLKNEGAKE